MKLSVKWRVLVVHTSGGLSDFTLRETPQHTHTHTPGEAGMKASLAEESDLSTSPGVQVPDHVAPPQFQLVS